MVLTLSDKTDLLDLNKLTSWFNLYLGYFFLAYLHAVNLTSWGKFSHLTKYLLILPLLYLIPAIINIFRNGLPDLTGKFYLHHTLLAMIIAGYVSGFTILVVITPVHSITTSDYQYYNSNFTPYSDQEAFELESVYVGEEGYVLANASNGQDSIKLNTSEISLIINGKEASSGYLGDERKFEKIGQGESISINYSVRYSALESKNINASIKLYNQTKPYLCKEVVVGSCSFSEN